jgi:hypothetical protein
MKYIIYIYLLFLKLIDTFTPFFIKKYKINNFIKKSLSGLLQNIQTNNNNNNKFIANPNSIIDVVETNCNLELKEFNNCKIKLIIPGYMDHNPKEVLQNNKLTK